MSQPICLVIGGTGGIGSAIAEQIHLKGIPLFLGARDEKRLKQTADKWSASFQSLDATNPEQVESFFQAAESVGPIGAVAHCVGSILLKPAHLTSPEDWAQTIALNLSSAFFVLRSAVKRMRENGGSLLFFSSAAAQVGLMNHEAIAAAKAGIEGLVRSAAATYASNQIRVNAIAPGLVDTPLASRITQNEAARTASESMHALQRIGKPEDLASLAAWILSEESSWMTGSIISIDGGLAHVKKK